MEKLNKSEIKENRRILAQTVATEGWPILKDMVNTYVLMVEREIMVAPAEDKDKMLALANKLKFGTGAMLWLLDEAEKIKEGLDNE